MVLKSDKTLSPFSAPAESRSSLRQALPQVLAVCVKNVLLLGFGMTLGFPTILIPSLSGNNPEESISLGQEAISWIGSINLICVPVGAVLSGVVTQPIGRKRAMQLVNIPFLTAWLLFHFSTDVWQIFLALCITGFTGGLLEAPTLTYVAEITKPSLRGILGSTSTVAVIAGILIQFLLGTFLHWRTVALLSTSAPIISFLLYFFVPESPHWLINKGRFLSARKSLAWLRGWVDVKDIEGEFQELSEQISKTIQAEDGSKKCANWRLYTKKNFLWPYFLVSLSFFLGHFSGMTTLQTYAVKIFAALKAPVDKYYATISLGVAEVFGCVLSAFLIHYVGKRVMNFFSLIGCCLCFLTVATYAYIKQINYIDGDSFVDVEETFWVPTIFLILSAFFTHAGIRILPWMLIGEVFANDIRSTASGLCGATSYIFGFVANKIFLKMVSGLTLPGTFWFYSAVCFVGTVALYFALPETEGKTLFEIIRHFGGDGKLDNKVYRNQNKIKGRRKTDNGEVNQGFTPDSSNNDSFYRSMESKF